MSEDPMGGYGAPAPELPEDSAPPRRDPRLIYGGIAAVVVVAVGGYLFLGGGGGGSAAPAAVGVGVHHPTTTPSASASPTVITVGKPTAAVRTFQGDVGRDPFQALVTAPAPVTTKATKPVSTTSTLPTAPATTPGSVVGGGSALPPGSLPTSGLPTSAPSTVISTTTPPVTKVIVVLKAIAFHGATPYVVVSYSGVQYMMKTGDAAGASLKVVAIAPDDGTATFQLGDQTFDLHIGQSYVD